jgi:hypothetical protein
VYTLIRSTSLTLQALLRARFLADPRIAPFFAGVMDVTLNNPEEMATNGIEGVSLWLYRVVRDEERLNAPPERLGPDRLRPPPLPVRLHYLITPIIAVNAAVLAFSPEREHLLLGKVLQTLYDVPLLRGTLLQDDLAGTPLELGVRLETLSLEEITRVWEGLNRPYQLSVSYEVAVVPIASEREPFDMTPVQIAMPEYGVITAIAEA